MESVVLLCLCALLAVAMVWSLLHIVGVPESPPPEPPMQEVWVNLVLVTVRLEASLTELEWKFRKQQQLPEAEGVLQARKAVEAVVETTKYEQQHEQG